jgi:hypothetical protein
VTSFGLGNPCEHKWKVVAPDHAQRTFPKLPFMWLWCGACGALCKTDTKDEDWEIYSPGSPRQTRGPELLPDID